MAAVHSSFLTIAVKRGCLTFQILEILLKPVYIPLDLSSLLLYCPISIQCKTLLKCYCIQSKEQNCNNRLRIEVQERKKVCKKGSEIRLKPK